MKISTIIDDNGQKFSATTCPTCGDLIVRLKSGGEWFWRCMHEKCGVFIPDDDGEPAIVAECPICHCFAVARYASKQKQDIGLFYQRCAACGGFFCDEDGLPGQPFRPSPVEITQDLQLAIVCNTVAQLETAMSGSGLNKQTIRRRIYVLEKAGYITTDPAVPGIGLSVAKNPTGSYI